MKASKHPLCKLPSIEKSKLRRFAFIRFFHSCCCRRGHHKSIQWNQIEKCLFLYRKKSKEVDMNDAMLITGCNVRIRNILILYRLRV